MANSDTDVAELELSSEDDHHIPEAATTSPAPTPSISSAAAAHPTNSASGTGTSPPSPSGVRAERDGDDADVSEDGSASRLVEDEDAVAPPRRRISGCSLDDGVSYASFLWDNTKAVVDQAEDARNSMKKMLQFLQSKAELDRSYAKSLRKLVEKATPEEEKPHTLTFSQRPPNGSPATTPTPGAASSLSSASSSSSFDLLLSSFRHLSLTLSSNFDLLAAKLDEQLIRPLSAHQAQHQRETRRIADDISRLHKQLMSLQDGLIHSKANAKKACQDLQIWQMEHSEKERTDRARGGGAAGGFGGVGDGGPGAVGVDTHTVFDDLVSSFRLDADGMKKRTLTIDNRYVQAVKALRSYRPQHDGLVRQLMTEAQREEEERRREQLRAVSSYCDLQAAMFDKYVRSARAVSGLSQQVNTRREMRQWIRENKGEGRVKPLPEYIIHKGHPRYDETQEAEEQHEHEGVTDDEDSAGGGDEKDDEEEEEEEEGEEPVQEKHGGDEEEEEDDEQENSVQGRRRRRRARRQHRKGGDELDELEDEKTEERIVAEKVLRVFIHKSIGNKQATAAAAAAGDSTDQSPFEISSPTLTAPLPRAALLPVRVEDLGEGTAIDGDEAEAAKAIFSTRDGRNAFATIFSCLSPTFYSSKLPLSVFSTFSPSPPSSRPATLTLPPSSFTALWTLTVRFLDATVGSNHLEPAIFVANVAHQILKGKEATNTAPLQPSSASAADDVMQKEQLETEDNAEQQSLLSHLSSHPLLADLRFFSSALFCSLDHHFAYESLYIHRWCSDEEQEAVLRSRRLLTLRLLGQSNQMMRHCGVKRRERRRFVEKQLRVFDLLGLDDGKEEMEALRKMNEKGRDGDVDGDESDDGSPIEIDGLREMNSDSDEERKQAMLRKKEEEKRIMNEEKKRKRRVKVNDRDEQGAHAPAETAAGATASRPRKEQEETRRREEDEREKEMKRAEEEERKMKKTTGGFFASLFGRSPSPSPPLVSDAQKEKTTGGPAVGGRADVAAASGGVRIPIPVAAAVPPPVAISLAAGAGASGKTQGAAAPAAGGKSGGGARLAVSGNGRGAAIGERKRVVRKRVVRKAQEASRGTREEEKATAVHVSTTIGHSVQPVPTTGAIDDMP